MKEEAIKKLKSAEEIVSKHIDAFAPAELMSLATTLRYLMAYVENNGQQHTIYSG
jgi:hypothetical protein